MTTQAPDTETIVRRHLQAFLEQKGVAAIIADYDENARFLTEKGTFRGKREIGAFFQEFIAALPPQAFDRFALDSLNVDGDMAQITWNIGREVPLGTDTFVVRAGKIVSQSFAMLDRQVA